MWPSHTPTPPGSGGGACSTDTGEILLTSQLGYSSEEAAEVAGARQVHAARTLTTPDHLEPA